MMKTKSNFLKKRNRQLIFYICLISIPLIKWLIFYIYGNLNAFGLAFQNYNLNTGEYEWYAFKNFEAVWLDMKNNEYFWRCMKNSLKVGFLDVFIGVPLSYMVGYYVYKRRFLARTYQIIIYIPQIISMAIMGLVYTMFTERFIPDLYFNLTGTKIDGLLWNYDVNFTTIYLFGIWAGLGGRLLIVVGTMGNISHEVVESAHLDGCVGIKELWYITFPLIWPTFVVSFISALSTIFGNDFCLYLLFEGSAPYNLHTFGYYFFTILTTASKAKYPYVSAFGLCATAIITPLILACRHYMTKWGPSVD